MLSRSRSLHRLLFGLAVGLSAVATSYSARALGSPKDLTVVEPTPNDISQAAQHFDEGGDAFRNERFVEAAEAFERADSLAPNAKVLLLAIQSRELGGDLARAATLAALAEQRHPNDPLFDNLTELLRKANGSLDRVTVACDVPCRLTVESEEVHGPAATRRYLYLERGNYRIRASWDEARSVAKSYEAEPGQRNTLTFASPKDSERADEWNDEDDWDEQSPDASEGTASDADWGDGGWGDDSEEYDDPPDDPLASDPAGSSDAGTGSGLAPWVFWTGASATAILTGVSIWSGINTINEPGKEAVVRECAGLGESCPTYQKGLRNQDRTNILWGVTAGVGLLTTLIGTLWTDWDGGPEAAAQATGSLRIRPVVSIGGMTDTGSGIGAAGINAPYVGAVGRF